MACVYVLLKLFPLGLPDSVVQILNAVSRVATVSDINKWNITTIDTLSSLMNLINGDWTSDQVACLRVPVCGMYWIFNGG